MKKLDGLGISPAPWKARMDFWIDDADGDFVFTDSCVANHKETTHANARLIAAAPELYQALWFQCFGNTGVGNCRNCKGAELGNCKTCPLGNARAALAKASGEGEV